MEQENNNDHLERFLHRAFDDFSANPSDGLWDKINADLSQETRPGGKVIQFIRPWQVAASLALILSLFLLQHFYFTSKIDALRDEMNQASAETNAAPFRDMRTGQEIAPPANANAPANTTNSSSTVSENPTTTHTSPIDQNSTLNTSTGTTNNRSSEYNNNAKPIFKKQDGLKPIPVQAPSLNTPTATPAMAGNSGTLMDLQPSSGEMNGKAINKTETHMAVLPTLPLRRTGFLSDKQSPAKFYGVPFPTKVNRNNELAINAHYMQGILQDRIKADDDHQGPFPGGGDDFFTDSKQTGTVYLAGLGIEQQLNKNWSAVSGVDYFAENIQQTLPAPLQFKDRNHGPGGGPPPGHHDDEHDFNYYFGAGTGTYQVEVELRAKDSTQTISENESVDLELTTSHQSAYLSVPLAMKYRFTKKHWTAFVMAGARVNYLLKNTDNLESFTCKNDRFEFRAQPKFEKSSTTARKLSSDLMVAAGLEYRIRHFGFSVSPTFNSPLVKPVKDEHVNVSSYWAGINAGVQYYF